MHAFIHLLKGSIHWRSAHPLPMATWKQSLHPDDSVSPIYFPFFVLRLQVLHFHPHYLLPNDSVVIKKLLTCFYLAYNNVQVFLMEGHGNLESYTYDVTIYLAHVLVLFCVCYSLDKQKVIDLESFTCPMELLIRTEHTASDDPHAPINWVGLGGGGRGPCPSPSTKVHSFTHQAPIHSNDSFLSNGGSLCKIQAKVGWMQLTSIITFMWPPFLAKGCQVQWNYCQKVKSWRVCVEQLRCLVEPWFVMCYT